MDLRLIRLTGSQADPLDDTNAPALNLLEVGLNGMVYSTAVVAGVAALRALSQTVKQQPASGKALWVAGVGFMVSTVCTSLGGLGSVTGRLSDGLD